MIYSFDLIKLNSIREFARPRLYIMLTNVSSLTLNIRLVEISNQIKDVCTLDFTPCLPLSSGITANFKPTFRPINADAIINGRLV